MKTIGIILAGGSGKRMGSDVKKQYMLLNDKPVLYYSLKTFSDSFIDEIVIVSGCDDIEYVKSDIVTKYGFTKVTKVVPGGKERYHSVLNGINAAGECDYIFIHDGARPMVTEEILKRGYDAVQKYNACVIGMPSKDTVKIADENGMVASTPNRNLVWNIQTPQIFKYDLIKEAYTDVVSREEELKQKGIVITDDAMVLEEYSNHPVKLVEGSYENIKITTMSDIEYIMRLL